MTPCMLLESARQLLQNVFSMPINLMPSVRMSRPHHILVKLNLWFNHLHVYHLEVMMFLLIRCAETLLIPW
uniref:Uncharacterized protein n=1 Tax=Arundo donax TaxID=35708 RepID=A0A0A9E8U4_ARUDO